MLFQYNYLISTIKLYKETILMTVKQTYINNTCAFLFENLLFTKVKQITKRSLRRASFSVLPKTRTNYKKNNYLPTRTTLTTYP